MTSRRHLAAQLVVCSLNLSFSLPYVSHGELNVADINLTDIPTESATNTVISGVVEGSSGGGSGEIQLHSEIDCT